MDTIETNETEMYSKTVNVVMGAPCSGKTTYVYKRADPNDLIWDFDAIHHAISKTERHNHIEANRKVVWQLREKFYEVVKEQKEGTVWIINTSPKAEVREMFVKEFGAKIIVINTTQEECLRIAEKERPEGYKEYIENYFRDLGELEETENIKIIDTRSLEKRGLWDKNTIMEKGIEKRYFNVTLETRDNTDDKKVVVGHAAFYNNLSEDLGGFREMIKPGAFDSVLDNDVRAFFNHDPNHLLARTSSGTLRLGVDEKGLRYEFDVPDTTSGRDLLVSMERGDITQSSFAFTVEDDSWDTTSKGGEIRTINKVKRLFDVSPVSIPAYPDSNDLNVAQRSHVTYKDKLKLKDEDEYEVKNSLLNLRIQIKKREQ